MMTHTLYPFVLSAQQSKDVPANLPFVVSTPLTSFGVSTPFSPFVVSAKQSNHTATAFYGGAPA
jgi:hypothetical protein